MTNLSQKQINTKDMEKLVFIVKKRGGGEHRLGISPWKLTTPRSSWRMVLRKKDKPHGRPGGCVVLNESSEMVQSGEKTLTWLGCGTTSRSSPR
jgi:hypothetical protein